MKNLILQIIESYEKRIDSVKDIIEGTQKLLQDYKEQRKITMEELYNKLKQSKSLRKKDFDRIMNNIRFEQNNREDKVNGFLNDYLELHNELITHLKQHLSNEDGSQKTIEQENLQNFFSELEEIKSNQEKKEIDVKNYIKKYQDEQSNFISTMNYLIAKKETISTSDLKYAINHVTA